MSTPNLPAVLGRAVPAVPPLGVGSHVRLAADVLNFGTVGGVVVDIRPERTVTHGTITFTALEDVIVAFNLGAGRIEEFAVGRDELEVLA